MKTAEAIAKAQNEGFNHAVTPVQLHELREQDFGYYEGKSFQIRRKVETSAEESQIREMKGFKEAESKDSLRQRATVFLEDQLIPKILVQDLNAPLHIAVVSHGMMLSALWKTIVKKQDTSSISFSPLLDSDQRPNDLEHLGVWTNTGYLEIEFHWQSQTTAHPREGSEACILHLPAQTRVTIHAINKRDHLIGLKRARGGIGSSAHDEKQQSIQSFFKKQRKV